MLHNLAVQSRDWNANLGILENTQRNLKIAQILRLRGKDMPISGLI